MSATLPAYYVERAGKVTHEMHSPITEYFVKTAAASVLEDKVGKGKPSEKGIEIALKNGVGSEFRCLISC